MDVVRLFSNSVDITPGVVLQQFLRFLGFYVEQNGSNRSFVGEDSILDIYLVSNDFFKSHPNILDDIDLKKSVMILKDGWYSEDESIKEIYWNENISNEDFLVEFIQAIYEQIEGSCRARLLRSDRSWKESAIYVAKNYAKYKLLESSLVTRCFYKQNEFYNWAIQNYTGFINAISDCVTSDYLKYVILLAKYESNMISQKNSYKNCYDSQNLLKECRELLSQYVENEELHLLNADILFELENNWLEACDRYGDIRIRHCAYALLKRGKILRAYYGKYENAVLVLKKAVIMSPHYYQAWYQLGECYEEMRDYPAAINVFKKVFSNLQVKLKRRILAPLEWEYLYKAIMRVAIIYKTRAGDYVSAYEYNDIANEIREEYAIDGYVKQMLEEKLNIEDIRTKIYEAIKEHVDIKLEEIY